MGTVKYDPQYERLGDALVHRYVQSTGDELAFSAANITSPLRGSGVHATVAVTLNGISLATDKINVDKLSERVHTINAALASLKARKVALDMETEDVKHAFDVFCLGLEEEDLNAHLGAPMAGAPYAPVTQLIRGLVVKGGGTMFFAPPGRGKTYTLLSASVCIDAGLSIPGVFEVKQREPVLFINLERSAESMAQRLSAVNRALGLPADRQVLFMNERGRSLADVYRAAKKTLVNKGIGVVVVDSLSRAGSGSLIDDEDANRAMDMLNGLAETWMLAAHTPRADESHAFGSQMFDAAIDVGVSLTSQQKNGSTGIALRVTKENDLGPQRPLFMSLDFGPQGLKLVRRANQGEFPDIEAGKKPSMEHQVTELLLLKGRQTPGQVAKEFGVDPSRASHLLRDGEKKGLFTVVMHDGREVFYGVKTDR